jgi:hypothetical protein
MQPLASSIISDVDKIGAIGEQFQSGSIGDDAIADALEGTVDGVLNAAQDFSQGLSVISTHTYPPSWEMRIIGAERDASNLINQLLKLKNLLRLWRLGQRNKVDIIKIVGGFFAFRLIPSIFQFFANRPPTSVTTTSSSTTLTTSVLIIPTEDATQKETQAIEAQLQKVALQNHAFDLMNGDVMGWLASLLVKDVQQFKNDKRIEYVGPDLIFAVLSAPTFDNATEIEEFYSEEIEEDEPEYDFSTLFKRDLEVVTGSSNIAISPPELRVVSQPKPAVAGPLDTNIGPFQFKADGGRGVNVYVFDTGMLPTVERGRIRANPDSYEGRGPVYQGPTPRPSDT